MSAADPLSPPLNESLPVRMAPAEWRAVGSLSTIYAIRMLGLFLLLPVLALYARDLPGSTPLLVGLAVGAYGLTQACLQIPFGIASDRLGRKPVIAFGLLLFALGSVLGAAAQTIHAVIAARAVQGLGAVSGPVTALLADVTRTPVRTRAMAFIGVSIGASFIVALVAGPLLAATLGVPGIFWLMAALAALGLLLLVLVAPSSPAGPVSERAPLARALAPALRPYYLGIFCLHFILTATFIAVPHVLHDLLAVPTRDHWLTYLGVFVVSLAGTVPLVLWAERSRAPDGVLRIGIAILMLGLGLLAFVHDRYWPVAAALVVFFAAFNFVEARLPARLSQLAGIEVRGAALGMFGTSQFAGAFAGGVAGGAMFGSRLGLTGIFGMASLVAVAWALLYRPGASAAK